MPRRTRRQLLASGAALTTAALTGCSERFGESTQGQYPKEVSVASPDDPLATWVLPGPRRLDEKIFGTPERPKGFESGIGVPLSARKTNDDGTEYTETTLTTAFSDEVVEVSGSFEYSVTDVTPSDGPESGDSVTGSFSFSAPDDSHEYEVTPRTAIAEGFDHPFRGGVMVDAYMHGETGIGTRMQPTQYVYAGFWAVTELAVDGETVSENRLLHVMTTERVRTPEGRLLFDAELPGEGAQTNVILPPVEVTDSGTTVEAVQTGFGSEQAGQPLINLTVYDSQLDGIRRL